MKKSLALVLCAALLLALAACGGKEPVPAAPAAPAAPAPAASAPAGGSRYVFALKGTKVAANADMAPIVDALGEPTAYFESESCAFQGLDKVYTYGSVNITTYPKDGADYVSIVELLDDTVATAEGVSIGASTADVTAAYGAAAKETDSALVYEDGDCTLSFLLSGGTVSAITYTAIVP